MSNFEIISGYLEQHSMTVSFFNNINVCLKNTCYFRFYA